MVQNPLNNNQFEQPVTREMFEVPRDVEQVLSYELTDSTKTKPPEAVGQTVVGAAEIPGYLDRPAVLAEFDSMSPEQKLILIGTNIQAMRRNALKQGNLNSFADDRSQGESARAA